MIAGALLAAQMAAAFNLVCLGTAKEMQITGLLKVDPISSKPYQATYRIDLAAGRWCVDACVETQPIAQVRETSLLLESRDKTEGDLMDDSYTVIDRETGKLESRKRVLGYVWLNNGDCKAAPFTGLPARLF